MKKKHKKHNKITDNNISLAKNIKELAMEREDGFFNAMLTGITEENPLAFFGIHMAVESLIELESRLCLIYHYDAHNQPHPLFDLDEEKKNYSTKRKQLETKLGLEKFNQFHEEHRKGHNECARLTLDNWNGKGNVYVLPKFNPDGTLAEPLGERDVPWNVFKR